MRLPIGQREGGPPGTAKNQPAINAQMTAQAFDVLDQMRCGVVRDVAERARPTTAALIKDDDSVEARIEKPAMRGRGTGTWPAMQE